MTKEQWKERALTWKERALKWKKKYLDMQVERNTWRKRATTCQKQLISCEDELAECEEEPDPQPDPDPAPHPPNKKLSVKDGKILYGGEPIKLCGVSRWEALWRAGEMPGYDKTWGDYSLEWYEQQLIESGINHVRHAGIKDSNFLYNHCERMKRHDINIEVTVFRAKKDSRGALVTIEDMGELAKLGNVFFDINNEFMDEPANVAVAISVARQLKKQGCIISGGAWSTASGKEQADDFFSKYDGLDIISHHRDWNEDSFRADVQKGKPVNFNEFFAMRSGMSLAKTKQLMKLAFDCGCCGVQYYGWRDEKLGLPGLTKFDPFDYEEMLNYAGGLVK